ncbi:MAG: DNA replication/repair protein RecF [Pseudomonadales bacterium]|nr:DNA replication/repair protein RecF [Pseudomonadales bacterium]
MSVIKQLDITAIRNIQTARLSCHPRLNLVFGANGSGKTSVLEAIYLLSRGRSFRTSQTDTLINRDLNEAIVFAQLGEHKLGLSRARNRKPALRLDEIQQDNWDRVARALPVLVIDSGTFSLLEGGPKARRQFLDWGVFHVEPGFIASWRNFRKSLANRNQLLKSSSVDKGSLRAWNQEFVIHGEAVDRSRHSYYQQFLSVLEPIYKELSGDQIELGLEYSRGWWSECSLTEALDKALDSDLRYKATQVGPQRADILLKVQGKPAQDVLSRGQQKILVCALKVAQGVFHSQLSDNKSIYLLDDLPAELDATNRSAVLQRVLHTGSQVFVTCVEREALLHSLPGDEEMTAFHVERGKISTVN